MKHSHSLIRACLVLLAAICLDIHRAAAAAPATQPVSAAGGVEGIVTAESEVPLSEMVVYLASPGEKRAIPPATQPATISQKDAQFEPRLLVVSVGQSVDFLNDEQRQIEHNVFSNSAAKRFDLGLYGPGKSKSVTFDKPGPVFLYCSIHRYMDGVIFVSPTPYTSRVDKDGRYAIENVPPGDWTLMTWQRRRRFPEKTIAVTVETDKPAKVNLELKRK
ncbi:MAG TPA: plastocyanin/azurin family copper-binding protein [Tepidisphaeraceae bacterium]|jgi:plastocyanin